jgi:hypothetical protein
MREPSVRRVNVVNLGLVVGSAAAAAVAPWELFLLAYAVLGPLHYLTEISWLHDRGYFMRRRYEAPLLVGLGVLAFLRYVRLVPWDGWVVLALGFAALSAFPLAPRFRIPLLAAVLGVTVAVERWSAGWLVLVALLPTVIHVFGFTALFMLHGSVRSRCPWGYASVVAFVGCAGALLLLRPPAAHYAVSVRTAALGEEFAPVIDQLLLLSGAGGDWDRLAAIGRFLGFVYTYHYLNWFSKTGIIRWHAVTGRRMAGIGGLYALSLLLYAYDYHVGLVALALLSLVHVFLEFPLDVRTFASLLGRAAS